MKSNQTAAQPDSSSSDSGKPTTKPIPERRTEDALSVEDPDMIAPLT